MSLGPLMDFSHSMLFAMAVANIIGLYVVASEVKADLASYRSRLASGEIRKLKPA